MVMARRPAGAGRIGLRLMSSLEPRTVTDCGFLNLLATEEVCEGDTIHDLNEAEAEFAPQPRTDLNRFTASATNHRIARRDTSRVRPGFAVFVTIRPARRVM
jgi:hypothetical protein